MGPMRFPQLIQYAGTNETLEIQDHKLTFDTAAEVNKLNNNNKNFSVEFIPWYQTSPNGLVDNDGIRLPDGSIPTSADIKDDPSLTPPQNLAPDAKGLLTKVEDILDNKTFLAELASNMFNAHKDWLDTGLNGTGGENWSEFACE